MENTGTAMFMVRNAGFDNQEMLGLLNKIIQDQEGGWNLEEDSRDHDGGYTFGGMTKTEFVGSGIMLSSDDIRVLIKTKEEKETLCQIVTQLYFKHYINNFYWNALPKELRGPYLSAIINLGKSGGGKVLQRAIKLPDNEVDGSVGPHTIVALQNFVEKLSVTQLMDNFFAEWKAKYTRQHEAGTVDPAFYKGLLNRVKYWEE